MSKYAGKTVNYSLYRKQGGRMKPVADTTSLQLPSLEYQSDSMKGAGIMGEVDMPSPSPGAMSLSASFRADGEDTAALGAPTMQELEVRWVVDRVDSSGMKVGVDAHKAIVKGYTKKFDPGKVEAGAAQDASIDVEVFYYKKVLNGKAMVEVDKLNGVLMIGGVDYYKQVKDNL